jgi:hypothetical protein
LCRKSRPVLLFKFKWFARSHETFWHLNRSKDFNGKRK